MRFKLSFILMLLSLNSFAFTMITNTGAHFSNHEINVYVASNTNCINNNHTIGDLKDYTNEAIKLWNRVPTSKLKLSMKGLVQTSDSLYSTGILCADDGTNPCSAATSVPRAKDIIITCNSETTNNFKSSQYLAISTPVYLSGGNLKGSVILLNDSANTQLSTFSKTKMISLIAHELGHAIGIGHSQSSKALMNYKNSSKRTHLGQDDIDAVNYLYPKFIDESCDSPFGGTIDTKSPPQGPWGMLIGLSICFLIYIPYKNFHT